MSHGWNRRGRRAEQFTASERRFILERDGGICSVCLRPGATEADHVIPISEGGSHSMGNARAICTACHRIKSRAESERGYARYQAKRKLKPEVNPFYAGGQNHSRSSTETQ